MYTHVSQSFLEEEAVARISAIIPVYNRRTMVLEALRSVLDQTRKADEIVVVDDGSIDGSGEAVRGFEGVTLITQVNRGISAARNAGIAAASGDFLAFLDSDDLWEKDKLLLQEQFMTAHPETPLCHTEEKWIRNGRRINPRHYHRKEGGFLFLRSLERCLVSPSAVMIRRDLFPVVGLFDEDLPVCEDYDLWLRITARYPVGFLPEPLTVKRGGHADQLSRKLDTMDRYRLDALEKVLRKGMLPSHYRRAALDMFRRKAKIIEGGLRKRAKEAQADVLKSRVAALEETCCKYL
jgi:glycosyltransferase involved in cell wall biosynthesis